MLASLYTPQVLFDGLIQGLVYGLLAMALVLVFRSAKVVNFAAGNIGLVGAGLFVLCDVQYGIPFWLSLAIALGVGTLYGAVVELVVVRRLFKAPRVILLVATIGVAQLSLLILNAYPDVVGERLPWPQVSSSTWTLGDIEVAGPQLVILVAAPVIAVALGLFLGRTPLGRTVRAAAGDADLARLRGINPKVLSTIVWALAGALSTAAIIMRTGLDGTTLGLQGVGSATLLRALIAALIARFESFRVALAAAVVIGVGESLVRFNSLDQPGMTELALLVTVLVAVAVQGRLETGSIDVPSQYTYAPQVRSLPERLRGIWWVRHLDRIVLLVLLAVALAVPFVVTEPSRQLLYTTIAAFAICALSLTVLTGWAGQLSLGQMALAGVGAFTGAALARGLVVDWVVAGRRLVYVELYALPFAGALVLGALTAALFAVVIGAGALRVRGLMLPVTTFAFAIAAESWLFRLEIFSGGNASSVPFLRGDLFGVDLREQRSYYLLTLAVLVVIIALLGRLRRSGVGRVTLAVRDNPDSAAAYTVHPGFVKLRAFALSGMIAGLGGVLLGGATQQIPYNESFFTVEFSLSLVAMVVIGGMGSTAGAVVGALWVIGLPALFPDNDLFPLLASSIGLLVLLLYFPGGLVHLVHRLRSGLYDWLERRLPLAEKATTAPPAAVGRTTRPPVEAAEALRCTAVGVHFGGLVANDAIDLVVRPGEIVGLIGTNGAGKSTLMNAIGGFVPATGTIELLGTPVHGKSAAARSRLGLGRTFQAARLFPELTVREAVQVALEARGRTSLLEVSLFSPRAARAERRKRSDAAELIDFLGLGRYADQPVASLSTGTRRIVELAGLLALDARVLCLDEPTAGVAQREAEAMGPLLVEIRRQLGASMLVIEHDMPLIMGMSDRVYCLELGKVIAEGDPVSVRNDPVVVASYLGTDERAIARSGAIAADPTADPGPEPEPSGA
ncbi:MAG: ATP-binding cassette domain-containing protein [Acidimicrobiales bacterium]|nr:ATP-binding cassette domain-containing protein [Acidimicrobiales bacterium]